MSNLQARQFDLIAFDWDGTLFDSTKFIVRAIQKAVIDVGGKMPTDEQAAYVIGLSLQPALAYAAPDVPPSQYDLLGQRYRFYYTQHQNDIALFDGVIEMLLALKKKSHHLAVATGKSRRGLDDALNTAQLKGMFDTSRTADETAGKPSPLMLQELMSELGVSAQRTLMIGDTTHDLEMAQRASCASVGVSYGAHRHEHFEIWRPRYIAHSVEQLHTWLMTRG